MSLDSSLQAEKNSQPTAHVFLTGVFAKQQREHLKSCLRQPRHHVQDSSTRDDHVETFHDCCVNAIEDGDIELFELLKSSNSDIHSLFHPKDARNRFNIHRSHFMKPYHDSLMNS